MVNRDYVFEENQGLGVLSRIFYILLMVILIGLLAYLIYMLYDNIPGSPEPAHVIVENQSFNVSSLSEVSQFYPNMKFNHNNISYQIDPVCTNLQRQKMTSAFYEISNLIKEINFHEVKDNADIDIFCSDKEKQIQKSDYFIAGEGGAKEIVQTGRYNVIMNGVILLYETEKNVKKCQWPNVEIHELMHVFGFNHSINKNSLMFPYLESCDQKLDISIVNELNRLYSEENLPDLYFDSANVIKKGRYLDFNFTVKNAGTIDAININYSVIDDGELVETSKLADNIKFGAGIYLEIKNLKVIHRNPKEIIFQIDRENSIKELNKENNQVKITFDQ
jgi:hypothetical protein